MDPPDLGGAAEIYEQLGRSCMEKKLLQMNAKGYWLQAGLCLLGKTPYCCMAVWRYGRVAVWRYRHGGGTYRVLWDYMSVFFLDFWRLILQKGKMNVKKYVWCSIDIYPLYVLHIYIYFLYSVFLHTSFFRIVFFV